MNWAMFALGLFLGAVVGLLLAAGGGELKMGHIYINRGWRECTVLAIIDKEALIEYEMPNGLTSLRFVARYPFEGNTWKDGADINDEDLPWVPGNGIYYYRNVTYRRVPDKWLKKMAEEGTTWAGMPRVGRECPGATNKQVRLANNLDDELHAPWEATYTVADYRAALAHAHALLKADKPYATKVFIAGFLRGLYPPREGSDSPPEGPQIDAGQMEPETMARLRFLKHPPTGTSS